MKILVISDSHGNIANLKHVMGFAKKIKAKAIIHCGDWDNVEAAEAVFSFDIPVYTVLGNADISHEIEDFLKFNSKKFDDQLLKVDIGGRKIGITHKVTIKNQPIFTGCDIVFSGHYHSPEQKIIDFRKFVRPGALINEIFFAVYETETNEVEFFKNDKI